VIDYTVKKKWDSLDSLNKRISSDYSSKKTKEMVKSFDGIQLVSNKFTYSLFDGELTKTKK